MEVQGTATSGQLWGLVLVPKFPIRVDQDVKIVWRMTGQGDLLLTVTAPDGTAAPLAWGPEPHTGSNYDRPGEEWGAGYRFTRPGCWTLHAARADTAADVWLTVDRVGPATQPTVGPDNADHPPAHQTVT